MFSRTCGSQAFLPPFASAQLRDAGIRRTNAATSPVLRGTTPAISDRSIRAKAMVALVALSQTAPTVGIMLAALAWALIAAVVIAVVGLMFKKPRAVVTTWAASLVRRTQLRLYLQHREDTQR